MATLLDRPLPIEDDATRRHLLVGGALTALFVACGGSDPKAPPTASTGSPRTLAGKEGTATIPIRPGRVVIVGRS